MRRRYGADSFRAMNPATHARPRRLAGVVLSGVATSALVAGCGGGVSGQAAASSSAPSTSPSSSSSSSSASSSASASAGTAQSPLAKGLLPASAFGADSTVVDLNLEQLQKTAAGKLGAATGLQVQPPQCAAALKGTQVDPSQVKNLVGKNGSSTSAGQQTETLEAIMTGDAVSGAVDQLKNRLATCSHVTATSPKLGKVSVQFSPIDASGVGAPAAAASYTTTITPPGHAAITVPAVIGLVRDGDRLILLLTAHAQAPTAAGAPTAKAPDPGAFTALLKQAYTTEHQALK